jgi:hypothetical protein
VLFAVPLYDSGLRAGEKAQRLSDLNIIKFERANLERQAASDIRIARDAVASTGAPSCRRRRPPIARIRS